MSHLHIPDGVLPIWLVVVGWVLTVAGIAVSSRLVSDEERRHRIPLVGAVAALMLVAMSSEIVPIAYHVNLTVVSGILLGPWLSIPTALVVVTVLGLIGHGGVTVIGLNTVVIATEMILGSVLFSAGTRLFGRHRAGLSAGVTTVVTLAFTTTLLVGIVALTGPIAATRESGAFDPETLRFENPFEHGVIGNLAFGHDEDEATHGQDGTDETDPEEAAEEQEAESLRLRRFALIVYGLGSIGWLIEALVTGGIIGFVARVRPALVFEGAASHLGSLPGDEGVHH